MTPGQQEQLLVEVVEAQRHAALLVHTPLATLLGQDPEHLTSPQFEKARQRESAFRYWCARMRYAAACDPNLPMGVP